MGINFPASPTLNQKYPQPAIAGIPVYTWDGEKWTTVGGSIAAYAPPADAVPLMDATPGLVGTTTKYAREDHVHPLSTSTDFVKTVPQTLTAPQQTQARSNIGVPSSNVAINGDFRVNQGGYVSAAALSAGAYGHDQWKAGASGGDYSFTQLTSSTQITIVSGKSLIQPIESANVIGGSYVLTWTGTAQARSGVNTLTPSGAYAVSPVLIVGQTAGTAMSIEFNAGTLGTVKLESGASATPFVMRAYGEELVLCQRYFQWLPFNTMFTAYSANEQIEATLLFAPSMRVAPTISAAAPDPNTTQTVVNGSASGWVATTSYSSCMYFSAATTGSTIINGYRSSADARL